MSLFLSEVEIDEIEQRLMSASYGGYTDREFCRAVVVAGLEKLAEIGGGLPELPDYDVRGVHGDGHSDEQMQRYARDSVARAVAVNLKVRVYVLDALYRALPFVEDAVGEGFKTGVVEKVITQVRTAINLAEGK